MTIRVYMTPALPKTVAEESGIVRVVENYHKYASDFDIEFVDDPENNVDVMAVHAGMGTKYFSSRPLISHLHGLYWTADYDADAWAWKANANVIGSIRHATVVTTPSEWVAESIRRDMRIDPIIVPHGIDWDEWQHNRAITNYILWNKNRAYDVCNPYAVGELARHFRDYLFVTTFAPPESPDNVVETGLLPHDRMKIAVQAALVYLSTTKETFGIGILEALASGTPVLGFAYGGNLILVEHGVNGYLARPGDYNDLANGLAYCIQHRDVLSANAKESAKTWTGPNAMREVKRS